MNIVYRKTIVFSVGLTSFSLGQKQGKNENFLCICWWLSKPLGKGRMVIPPLPCLPWGSKPSTSGSSPHSPRPGGKSTRATTIGPARLTFHQHLSQILAKQFASSRLAWSSEALWLQNMPQWPGSFSLILKERSISSAWCKEKSSLFLVSFNYFYP